MVNVINRKSVNVVYVSSKKSLRTFWQGTDEPVFDIKVVTKIIYNCK